MLSDEFNIRIIVSASQNMVLELFPQSGRHYFLLLDKVLGGQKDELIDVV